MIPRQATTGNGGPQLSGMLRTADYKHGKALKSCQSEFSHIHKAAIVFTAYRFIRMKTQ